MTPAELKKQAREIAPDHPDLDFTDAAAQSCVIPFNQVAQERVMLAGYVGHCVEVP